MDWRGFALPRLQMDRSALAAPMTILMIFWAVRVVKIYVPAQLAPEPKITL
ncbi:MAG: hypothetical protein RBT75_17785 [Anaerolineae bacterium]|jgi:hypothetical protein|nr:hypothetical protein [Anaerolineae bacterium]